MVARAVSKTAASEANGGGSNPSRATMNIDYIKQLPNSPGIYLITNKVNNKHYVGQTIKLRKRLLKHLSDSLNNTRVKHILLYKAFRKYGIDNFEVSVLYEVEYSNNVKQILDEKETAYIQEYNSYGKLGYNQTLGGDAGVLGYKMTNEQREKIKQATLANCINRKQCFAKNLVTGEITMYSSIVEMSQKLGIQRTGISKCLAGKQKKVSNKEYSYICSTDINKLN